jgi:MFS family permease
MTSKSGNPVSPYRWVVLILFMLPAIATQVQWISLAPVATEGAKVYAVDTQTLDLLAAVFMLVYIPMSFPASWCIDRFGLKWGTGIGVIILGISGFLRMFAPDFTWLMVFQVGCAIGQPFVLNSFTKVAGNWFPQEEEALASGLATMSVFLGLAIAMFAPGIIMAQYGADDPSKGIHLIMDIYGIFSLAGMLLYFFLVKDKPATPPNPIAAEKKATMLIGIKSLFKNRDFLYLLGAFFIGLGAFNAIMSMIEDIFKKRVEGHILDTTMSLSSVASIIGGLIIVGGIFGAVILSALSDKFHKRKIFLVLAMAVSLPLTIALNYFPSIILLGITAAVLGFFLVSALPIGLTYAVERTHPVPEATSNGMLMLSGQISGIILVAIWNITGGMNLITILFAAGLICALLMKDIAPKEA